MIIDLREADGEKSADFDICVIGAGAAGITLAMELAEAGLRVCLLEGGGLDYSDISQNIYAGVSDGYGRLDTSRLRFFGGTTNHWTGYCRRPTEDDYGPSKVHEGVNWPISLAEMQPFLDRAQSIVDVGGEYEQNFWNEVKGTQSIPDLGTAFEHRLSLVGPPVRFKERFSEYVRTSEKIVCFINANVQELRVDVDGSTIEHIRVADLNSREFKFQASSYVLACGGIENARMLLQSNSVIPEGLGNHSDLVGRYFCDHCVRRPGKLLLKRTASTQFIYELGKFDGGDKYSVVPHLETTTAFADSINTPRVIFRFYPAIAKGYEPSTIDTIKSTLKSFWHGEYGEDLLEFNILAFVEPILVPQNRVTLGDAVDRFGNRRANLFYRPSELEVTAITKGLEALASQLGRSGSGKVRLDQESLERDPSDWGWHHYCTTKMDNSPDRGVVDSDCRVHGIGNLYIAGSSTFPRAGLMTPTMSIVAMSLRLANVLKSRM